MKTIPAHICYGGEAVGRGGIDIWAVVIPPYGVASCIQSAADARTDLSDTSRD
jgi:hypothetical protein